MIGAGLVYSFDLGITTAQTSLALAAVSGLGDMSELSCEFNFAFGTGGSSWQVWLQSTLSEGARWYDIASVSGSTASLWRSFSLKRTNDTALYTPGNGVLAAGIATSIAFGDQLRCLVTTTGTYGGNTVLSGRVVAR